MTRLDAEAEVARQPREHGRLAPDEVVRYLRSLRALWTDAGPDDRQALATALFAKTDVLGYERMEYELAPDAIALGLNAALPAVLELGTEREFGRRERASASLTQQSVRFVMINLTPRESFPVAAARSA